ncbi:serine/threonine protein phosphatase PrpC [Kitasatospora sp. MAA4]|uniref:PP2C family protein-serine/threonine phosphatase n=1 Tax=Kitasatospora sp. MAA4 TaxID=3035093 RepID=UPI00247597D3|nr:protein phosphatase 2C domain-containing protein [Kitasatospora sp. MAA4]MDH6134692.1 serine/threonine protein phosphatase PrpC [Kitasatospora sp. MAA4]
MSLVLRFAAGSHKGLIREGNEDSGYAGPRLLAVADGMGGAAAGEVASSEALSSIVSLDEADLRADLLTLLSDAVHAANERLRVMVEQDPQLEGMGCTLTALLWTGERMGLAHVGDSRAYLLRDGSLTQITQDHTWVQRLVDEGRITAEEAETHPQRSLLMRALDGRGQVEPDLSIREVRAGDRYLICSDGLSGPVSHQTLEETLGSFYAPEQTIQELIQLALRGGGPDNITCIVADVIEVGATDTLSGQFAGIPMVVGAVAEGPHGTATDHAIIDTPAGRAAGLGRQQPPAPQGAFGPADGYQGGYDQGYDAGYDQSQGGFGPAEGYGTEYPADGYGAAAQSPEGYGAPAPAGEYDAAGYRAEDYPPAEEAPRKRRWFKRSAILVVALGLVGGAAYGGWQWTQGQYYVAEDSGHVAVYRGISQNLAGLSLSSVYQEYPNVELKYLPVYQQNQLKNTIDADSLDAATKRVQAFDAQAAVCKKVSEGAKPTGTAATGASPTPSSLNTGGAVTGAAFLAAPKVGASPAAGTASPSTTPAPSTPAPSTPPPPAASPSGPVLTPEEQTLAADCASA